MTMENEFAGAVGEGWLRGTSRRQADECLSDLQLDQLALDELDGVTADRARLHLGQCQQCENAAQAIRAAAHTFERTVNVPQVAALAMARAFPSQPRKWALHLAWPAGLSLAATALVMFSLPSQPSTPGVARIKGAQSLSLQTYVKFASHDGPGATYTGQPLAAGDRVQFRITSATAGHLAILSASPSVGGALNVSAFYPAGPTTAPLAAGKDMPLGNAVELDAAEGPETVIALLCSSEREVSELAGLLQAATLANGVPLVTGCVLARTTLNKTTSAADKSTSAPR